MVTTKRVISLAMALNILMTQTLFADGPQTASQIINWIRGVVLAGSFEGVSNVITENIPDVLYVSDNPGTWIDNLFDLHCWKIRVTLQGAEIVVQYWAPEGLIDVTAKKWYSPALFGMELFHDRVEHSSPLPGPIRDALRSTAHSIANIIGTILSPLGSGVSNTVANAISNADPTYFFAGHQGAYSSESSFNWVHVFPVPSNVVADIINILWSSIIGFLNSFGLGLDPHNLPCPTYFPNLFISELHPLWKTPFIPLLENFVLVAYEFVGLALLKVDPCVVDAVLSEISTIGDVRLNYLMGGLMRVIPVIGDTLGSFVTHNLPAVSPNSIVTSVLSAALGENIWRDLSNFVAGGVNAGRNFVLVPCLGTWGSMIPFNGEAPRHDVDAPDAANSAWKGWLWSYLLETPDLGGGSGVGSGITGVIHTLSATWHKQNYKLMLYWPHDAPIRCGRIGYDYSLGLATTKMVSPAPSKQKVNKAWGWIIWHYSECHFGL